MFQRIIYCLGRNIGFNILCTTCNKFKWIVINTVIIFLINGNTNSNSFDLIIWQRHWYRFNRVQSQVNNVVLVFVFINKFLIDFCYINGFTVFIIGSCRTGIKTPSSDFTIPKVKLAIIGCNAR